MTMTETLLDKKRSRNCPRVIGASPVLQQQQQAQAAAMMMNDRRQTDTIRWIGLTLFSALEATMTKAKTKTREGNRLL
jgi:hypothetical protein